MTLCSSLKDTTRLLRGLFSLLRHRDAARGNTTTNNNTNDDDALSNDDDARRRSAVAARVFERERERESALLNVCR